MPLISGIATKRDFSTAQRKTLAHSGAAMANGSYPIENAGDLRHAIDLVGMGKDSEGSVKAHIIARAKALGLTGSLPDAWTAQKRDLGLIRTKKSYPTIPEDPATAVTAGSPDLDPILLKKPKKFTGAQTTPMNAEAINSSLAGANS